ncbi:MAG: hypothetical protein AAGA93_13025 [Actinomycetota bacterium]
MPQAARLISTMVAVLVLLTVDAPAFEKPNDPRSPSFLVADEQDGRCTCSPGGPE